jgi:hypothetical protein
MMKTLFVVLVVCVAVTVAMETVNDMGERTHVELETAEDPEFDAKEALVATTAKMSSSARHVARTELQDAFINANLDSDWLEQQELLEVKTAGSGYADMKEIMIKVDELEKKIQERLASDLKYITAKREDCASTRGRHENTLRDVARYIKKSNAVITYQQAKVAEYLASRAKSRLVVAETEKEIEKVTELRRGDTAGYQQRLTKRLKEIQVLHTCNLLVCTEFADFKTTELCAEIRRDGTKTEDHPGQVTTTSLSDLLKQADTKEAIAEAAKNMEKAKAEEAAAKAKAGETLKVNSAPTTQPTATAAPKETQRRMTVLLQLLQSSHLPPRTYTPARRVIMMLRTGEAAKTNVAKDIKEMTLPESLVNLLHRVVDDQKRETIDYMNQLNVYHKQIVDYGKVIQAEVDRQNDMEARVTVSNGHIESARTNNVRRALERDVTTHALLALNKHCREEDEAYAKRREGRLGELVNVEKLRSLLRVLQNSDLPKCPGDCVDKDHGRCVWAGRFGKDSYCSCENEYYGEGCEHTKCKGKSQQLYEASDKDVCNTRGSCDQKDGTCTCGSRKVSINGTATHTLEYYHGQHKSCENARCPGNGDFDPTRDPSQKYACNRRGSCDIVGGTCRCDTKYYGTDCSRVKCPGPASGVLYEHTHPSACSGRGSCDYNNGTCRCDPKYTGSNCGQYTCPNNCSGRGTCNTNNGTCNCNNGYTGRDCSLRTCLNNCHGSTYGSCNQVTGQCSCNSNGSGPNCRRPTLSQFYKAYYVWWTFDVTGWSWCHGNTFLVGIRRNSCPYLYCIEEFMCARPNEVSDTSYSRANGTRYYMPSMSSCSTYHFRWHTGSYWYEWAGGWGWNKRFWRSMIHRSCPGNMWINGLWRNGHIHPWYQNYLNNLWYFHCCSLGGGFYWTNCRWKSWTEEMATSRGSGSPYYPSLRWAVTSNFPTVSSGHDYGYPTSYYSNDRGYAGDYMIAGFGRSRMVEAGHINDLRVILECRYRR